MRRSAKHFRHREDDTELNMVPVMNMFMVLIPFLLMSATFFHVKAINTSVPIHSQKSASEDTGASTKRTAVVEIKEDQIRISLLPQNHNAETSDSYEKVIHRRSGEDLPIAVVASCLKNLKDLYPASDTIILIPYEMVIYDEIIRIMDCARQFNGDSFFPNVILSGNLG